MVIVALVLASSLTHRSVPPATLSHFRKGANITRWFCYLDPSAGKSHFDTYFTAADFKEFKDLNFDFCRLCLSPEAIYKDGTLNPSTIGSLDQAVDRLTKNGIAVIWDLHDNGQLKLDQASGDRKGFIRFWTSAARHYKGKAEGDLVFELLNEPVFQKNPQDWYSLQSDTVREIRKVDPKRTIMVSPTSWSSIDNLSSMKRLTEGNLIYTFHCYDPFFFTHQGAEWVGEYPGHFKKVPFPASPESVAQILPQNEDKYRGALEGYGQAKYDAAYIKGRVSKAVAWGKENNVPVLFGEFGAYPKVSPPDSRARWFEAMRAAINSQNVPSSIWGYDDGLGLGRTLNPDGTLHLDEVTLKHFYGK